MRHVVEATEEDVEARTEARQFGSRVGIPWVVWLWVPPLGGVVRYPVLRTYQYICMAFAWIVLVVGQITAAIVLITGIGAARETASAYSALGSDGSNSGLTILFAFLTSVYISVWSDFIFLSLRAVVEVIQVYLDIEDNTRSSATALSKLRSKSASKGKSAAPPEQSPGDEEQPR